jgi:ATP-dependent Clp protease protease subunit
MLAENTGQDYEKVARDTDRDHFLSAEESIDYGLVDGILRQRGEES